MILNADGQLVDDDQCYALKADADADDDDLLSKQGRVASQHISMPPTPGDIRASSTPPLVNRKLARDTHANRNPHLPCTRTDTARAIAATHALKGTMT